ncbi:D-amino acid aminotransferase [Phyllobacterium phragmitis]|uniref:Probable branched-chain-amino-acid aminotransferase n=1 Tax=Phyllobacterium phragmitis TaxID=2670329 RepID=A0A2S9IK54_9HYPH|nr:D-amino-acid transaminase [Phyllobacterium phragmitis]PRD40906.1 D-amino acid aminotransferase [Phyllobacterium phragmitis]
MADASPSRIVYVNGAFLPIETASIPVMDRGFLFGDGIYEVTALIEGHLADNEAHLRRLDRSLREIEIPNPHSQEKWTAIQQELVMRNGLTEGLIYIEVTRGVSERDFLSPADLKPTVVMFTQAKSVRANAALSKGADVITVPDLRWARRDIKSTSLLAQVLAKRAAAEAGASEAWMVEDGAVTEGASSTAFIVTQSGEIVSRPLSHAVLPGVTRRAILRLVDERNLTFVERTFTVEEALRAREAFFTSASTIVMPVVSIDGQPVGDGKPGPLALQLRELYIETVLGTR